MTFEKHDAKLEELMQYRYYVWNENHPGDIYLDGSFTVHELNSISGILQDYELECALSVI